MKTALLNSQALLLCTFLATLAASADPVLTRKPSRFPTPNPPSVTAPPKPYPLPGDPPGTLWSIGQPTDQEQLYLEYINRSRANPPAEGLRLANTTDPDVVSAYADWSVNLGLMQTQFNAIPAVPPLAMNAQLLAAARLHSGDMFTNNFQGHNSSGTGALFDVRISAQGYLWSTCAENVFSYAASPWHGHAGFNVDWGPGTGGMQTPPGHRANIHSSAYREIGVGVVNGGTGMDGNVGPQLVTQDFATRQSATPLLTGVVYYDLNGNSFYDVGEGIGGVTVVVPGSTYWARTADSGGYAVPVTTNGNYGVSFSASNLTNYQLVNVASLQNRKVDYRPTYSPPTISGPNPASVGQPNNYTFTSVGAATGYDWEVAALVPYTAVEGAETGLDNVTVTTTGLYPIIDSAFAASGVYSFHLANPNFADESITLNAALKVAFNSTLNFSKKLSWATTSQVARAQVSADGGLSWGDVWSQAGNNGPGESIFSPVSVSLAAYSGQIIRIRFLYDFTGGGAYTDFDPETGLRLDNIAIANAEQLASATVNSVGTNSFIFTPTSAGNYQLRVRARINTRTLPYGPPTLVSATIPPASIQSFPPVIAGNQVQIDFLVNNYTPGMNFSVLKASAPSGTFSATAATFQTIIPNSRFRATVTKDAANSAYYRIMGMY